MQDLSLAWMRALACALAPARRVLVASADSELLDGLAAAPLRELVLFNAQAPDKMPTAQTPSGAPLRTRNDWGERKNSKDLLVDPQGVMPAEAVTRILKRRALYLTATDGPQLRALPYVAALPVVQQTALSLGEVAQWTPPERGAEATAAILYVGSVDPLPDLPALARISRQPAPDGAAGEAAQRLLRHAVEQLAAQQRVMLCAEDFELLEALAAAPLKELVVVSPGADEAAPAGQTLQGAPLRLRPDWQERKASKDLIVDPQGQMPEALAATLLKRKGLYLSLRESAALRALPHVAALPIYAAQVQWLGEGPSAQIEAWSPEDAAPLARLYVGSVAPLTAPPAALLPWASAVEVSAQADEEPAEIAEADEESALSGEEPAEIAEADEESAQADEEPAEIAEADEESAQADEEPAEIAEADEESAQSGEEPAKIAEADEESAQFDEEPAKIAEADEESAQAAEIAQLRRTCAQLRAQQETILSDAHMVHGQLSALQATVEAQQAAQAQAQAELQAAQAQHAAAQAQAQQAQAALQELEAAYAQQGLQLAELRVQDRQIEAVRARFEAARGQMAEEVAELRAQLRAVGTSLEDTEQAIQERDQRRAESAQLAALLQRVAAAVCPDVPIGEAPLAGGAAALADWSAQVEVVTQTALQRRAAAYEALAEQLSQAQQRAQQASVWPPSPALKLPSATQAQAELEAQLRAQFQVLEAERALSAQLQARLHAHEAQTESLRAGWQQLHTQRDEAQRAAQRAQLAALRAQDLSERAAQELSTREQLMRDQKAVLDLHVQMQAQLVAALDQAQSLRDEAFDARRLADENLRILRAEFERQLKQQPPSAQATLPESVALRGLHAQLQSALREVERERALRTQAQRRAAQLTLAVQLHSGLEALLEAHVQPADEEAPTEDAAEIAEDAAEIAEAAAEIAEDAVEIAEDAAEIAEAAAEIAEAAAEIAEAAGGPL